MPSTENRSNQAAGQPPLVRIERIDDVLFAVCTDPNRPGYEYDPSVRSAEQAMEIARQLVCKRWVTLAHLQQFATLMLAEFSEGAAHG